MTRLDRLLDRALEEGLDRHLPDDPQEAATLRRLYEAATGDIPSLDHSPIEHAALAQGLSANLRNDRHRRGSQVGPFEIEAEIGSGGMGTVYRARRIEGGFEQRVAIKMLNAEAPDPGLFQLFQRERQLLAQLEHPGIARLVDGGLTESWQPWFAMEYIDGRPLDLYCNAMQCSVKQRLALVIQVCEALDHAHRQLILHRDIKPGNLLITPDERTCLVDFGLGRILDEFTADAPEATITAGRLTPQYASPEQARGESVGVASDIYQLGLVVYGLLCGRLPYDTRSLSAYALAEIISGASIERPSEQWRGQEAEQRAQAMFGQSARVVRRALRGDVDNIVLKALARSPERRYGSARELADDLRRHLNLQPVNARAATRRYRLGRFIARNAFGVAVSAIAAATLLAGIVTVLFQSAELATERDRAVASAERNERLADALAGMIRLSDASGPIEQLFTVGERLQQYRDHVDTELAADPRLQSRLLTVLGEAFQNLRYWDQARDAFERALSLQTSGDGEAAASEDLRTSLARARAFAGDLDGAWALLDDLLEEVGSHTSDEADLRYLRGYLKTYHLSPGSPEFADGLRDLETALAHYRAEHGSPHADIARAAHALGLKHPDPDEALALVREAITMTRSLFGQRHELTATRLAELALLHDRLGQFGQAARIGREAHELHAAVRGETHPETLTILANLAGSLRESGELAESASIYERLHELRLKTLPENHLLLAYTAHGLGNTYRELGEYTHSERWLREALRLCLLHDSPNEAITRVNLSRTLEAAGRLDAAREEQRAAVVAYRRHGGAEHPALAQALERLDALAASGAADD